MARIEYTRKILANLFEDILLSDNEKKAVEKAATKIECNAYFKGFDDGENHMRDLDSQTIEG